MHKCANLKQQNHRENFFRFFGSGCSPILSHVNATLQGLASVHTSGAESILEKEFHEFQDQSVSSWFLAMCATRWFGFWLDVICLAFIAVVTHSFLLMENGKTRDEKKIKRMQRLLTISFICTSFLLQ